MNYTEIKQEDKEELENICQPVKFLDIRNGAMKCPTYFCKHVLGFQPQTFQHLVFRAVKNGHPRIAICSSRQIGKSVALATIAVWFSYYNLRPSGRTEYDQNTKVIVISRDAEASKKLMGEIRSMLFAGDAHMNALTEGKIRSYFTHSLSQDRKDPDNKTQITFKPKYGATRGCTVQCFPPTDAVRGNSADVLIIDEDAFVDDEIYQDAIKPTVATTGGIIILSSTPKGQHGHFFEIFDPFDRHEEHEYKRFWFPWTVCEIPAQRGVVEVEKHNSELLGKMKSFSQEYEASFVVDEESFFDSKKVDSIFNDNLSEEYEYNKTPCALGIDYGMTNSRTVITVVTKEEDGKIRILYQHEFEPGFDDNLLMEDNLGEHNIPQLMKRYDIKWIIPDSCAQGYRTNKEMQSKGYPVVSNKGSIGGDTGWNFRSDQADRNRGYISLKSKINSGLVQSYPNKPLEIQMKALQAVDNKIYTSIRAPKGVHDDRIDSLMMACVPFTILDESGDLETEIIHPQQINTTEFGSRQDKQMENMMKNANTITKQLKEDEEEAKLWI